MVVLNEVGGVGQSSLLARFASVYSVDHPTDVVIEHCILFLLLFAFGKRFYLSKISQLQATAPR